MESLIGLSDMSAGLSMGR